MKWRLTRRFLVSIVLIVGLIVVMNTLLLIALLFIQSYKKTATSPEAVEVTATRFSDEIIVKNGKPTITNRGQKILEENHAWVQILNKEGKEVAAYQTPASLPTSYSPVEIVQMYKYKEVNGKTTVFVGEAENLSYFFGIEDPKLMRVVYNFNFDQISYIFTKLFLVFLVADLLIATLVGFLFGSRLTKPMYKLIEGIHRLKHQDYEKISVKGGPYREVFENMNDLSTTLKSVETERKKLDQMRNEWIGNVSHDLKTPLASIQGYAELLQEDVTDEERLTYTQIIEQKSLYMRDLLNDLNLTTKLQSGTFPLQKEKVLLSSFVRECVIDVLNDPIYQTRSITFEAESETLSATLDSNLFKRALLNFIYNALIHNSENTDIQINLSTGYPQEYENYFSEKLSTDFATIQIIDFGKGIPVDEQPFLFNRYYRGTNTKDTQGSGLGMAIAQDIIQAHDGVVYIKSKEGEGTTISIVLPLQ